VKFGKACHHLLVVGSSGYDRRLPHSTWGVLLVCLLAVVIAPAGTAQARQSSLPRVTVIGDSVAVALGYDNQAVATLKQGVDLQLQLAPCRRVDQQSCPYQGVRPLNVVELVKSLGSQLGPTVVIAVGYNDFEDQYAGNIETALAALKQAGVTRVLWQTLHTAYHSYLTMNDAIFAAAARHPEMTVVDWNVYSLGHPEWFQSDNLHLNAAGAEAMASLIHRALVQLGIPVPEKPPPTSPPKLHVTSFGLPDAVQHRPYATLLHAVGGTPPYRWSPRSPLPAGLKLSPTGRLGGVPRGRTGIFRLVLRVADAAHRSAKGRVFLRVRPPRKPSSTTPHPG
jgi:lysophospholipase L1-like esterase